MRNRAERVGFTREYLGRARLVGLGLWIVSRDSRHWAFVSGVPVEIPARVDGSKRAVLRALGEDDPPIALLLGTRHQDGYIREASVAALAERGEQSADHFPFLLLAIGDYVHQVADRAATALLGWDPEQLRHHAVANPGLVGLVRARTLSYGIGVDATTRLAALIAEPDWFSRTLASGVVPDLETFDQHTDTRFPYFDDVAWRAAVELAARVSPWAEWQVLYEVLCPPRGDELGRDRQLMMLGVWAEQFGREPASTFLLLGNEIATHGGVSREQLLAARSAVGADNHAHRMLDNLEAFLPLSRAERFRYFFRRR